MPILESRVLIQGRHDLRGSKTLKVLLQRVRTLKKKGGPPLYGESDDSRGSFFEAFVYCEASATPTVSEKVNFQDSEERKHIHRSP
jgi:hypothetical protein